MKTSAENRKEWRKSMVHLLSGSTTKRKTSNPMRLRAVKKKLVGDTLNIKKNYLKVNNNSDNKQTT